MVLYIVIIKKFSRKLISRVYFSRELRENIFFRENISIYSIQVLKRWTTLFWKNVLSKFRKKLTIMLIFRKLNKNFEKF